MAGFVKEYTTVRLHCSIGYITPQDRLEGREQLIQTERRRKLADARLARRIAHRSAGCGEPTTRLEPAGVAGSQPYLLRHHVNDTRRDSISGEPLDDLNRGFLDSRVEWIFVNLVLNIVINPQ